MRKLYLYCGVMLCLIAAGMFFLAIQPRIMPLETAVVHTAPTVEPAEVPAETTVVEKTSQPTEQPEQSEEPTLTEEEPAETRDSTTTEEPDTVVVENRWPEPAQKKPKETPSPADELIPYTCPDCLSDAIAVNPDVYAWITIPGTNIDYPVVQSPESDTYYLRRDINGNYLLSGMIMTEHSYNTTTFEDPVTVIYGHCMDSGAMFGNMQSYYCSENGLEKYKTIQIDLPDKELVYEVFAAVPYDNRHILFNYDFHDLWTYRIFFRSISSIRSFNAQVNSEELPNSGDKVIVLSTCLMGDSSKRYLVMAKQKNYSKGELK